MASKPLIGKVSEFNEDVESFENYVERLGHFFSINTIDNDHKVSFFVSVIGPTLYSTLKDLLHPKLIKDEKYEDIIKVLKNHFTPKCNTTYERFVFHKRVQKEGETITDYAMQLKKLASTCNFGNFLDDALRDQFLCGLKSSHILSKLLAEGDSLTFPKALELSLVLENADRNVRSLHPEKQMTYEVSYVRGGKPSHKGFAAQSAVKPKSFDARNGNKQKCYRCGKLHDIKTCPYVDYTCFSCQKKGHLANMCKFKNKMKPGGSSKINFCDSGNEDEGYRPSKGDEDAFELYTIAYANDRKPNNFVVNMVVNQVPVDMVIDTGAVVTCMPDKLYFEKFNKKESALQDCNIKLKTYTGEQIQVLGKFQALVTTEKGEHRLPVVVVKTSGGSQPTLMGRNWLEEIQLDWRQVKSSVSGKRVNKEVQLLDGKSVPNESELVADIKKKFAPVFEEGPGEIKGSPVNILLKDNSKPVFCKARSVPFALRKSVEIELEKLQNNGVIYPVTKSEWATPIVVVPKPNNEVRICGDFKVTINPCLRTDHYPLPNPEDILTQISGAKLYSKLDLSAAYSQLKVNKSSQELLTINTHKGLFRYRKLAYGITSAPSIFQATMDDILSGIKNTACYIDDILIFSKTLSEMQNLVESVLKKLMEHGVKINMAKSEFFKKSLVFLGYRLDEFGIHQSEELTRAILNAPKPENVSQLRSFLGLINFYGKFIPNLATLLHPLYQLLNKDVNWSWCKKCAVAYEESKRLLVRDNVLMPYDPNLDIVVTCDSSSYGIGCVIAHSLPDGTERPIAFASRTLTKCEVKYGQIEKEALSLVYAVKKFHKFLYARKFTLITDHRPLTFLLGPTKGIPTLAAARIQRWALILTAYQYDIRYKKGTEISNADALSRLPCDKGETEGEIAFFSYHHQLPITSKEIATATRFDPVLSKVLDYVSNGWPGHIDDGSIRPYFNKNLQLSVENGCILWCNRVVVPPVHQKEILLMLHSEHPGESRMKALARSFVWWPGLDRDVEEVVKTCSICQKTRKSAPLAPLHTWTWPKHSWQRIHLDFAYFEGKEFLIVVDSFSKWIEVFYMPTTTSKCTIDKLRHCFATFGLASTVVTDGGPQFKSVEFKEFLESNGVHHILTPPYHPASNGLAERAVQTVKDTFLKQMLHDAKYNTKRSLQHRIDSFLFSYRNTPHSMTGLVPSEIMFKFSPKTHLSLLKPHLTSQMEIKQENILQSANNTRKPRNFELSENVYVRTVRQEQINWQPGIVTKVVSPVTYLVKVDGRIRFVHIDHLRSRAAEKEEEDDIMIQFPREKFQQSPKGNENIVKSPQSSPANKMSSPPAVAPFPQSTPNKTPGHDSNYHREDTTLRRSSRPRRAPQKLNL